MVMFAATILGLILLFATIYSNRVRHPEVPRLAAFMIFTTVFAAVAISLFALLIYVLRLAGQLDLLQQSLPMIAFLAIVFVPAFLAGRWQIRKPPRRRMPR